MSGDDNLILVDSDKVFIETIRGKFENVYAHTETEYDNGSVEFSDLIVFPSDELKRQKREVDSGVRWYNEVEEKFYNKKYINQLLCKCGINVPKTFECHNVFIRPNTYSAGSKGVYGIENVSVTEQLDIENEYVVDVFCHRKEIQTILSVYPREVVLRNGYDKYIKFLPSDSDVVEFVKELVQKCDIGLFNGVFNVQIVRSRKSRYIDHAITVNWQKHSETRKDFEDYVFDKHTRKGKSMGRGLKHFYEEGCKINNANKIHGEEELENKAWEIDGVSGVFREDVPATDAMYRKSIKKDTGEITLF